MKKTSSHRHERLIIILRQIRLEAGLTQAELAARIGKHQVLVSRYESGQRQLNILETLDVCQAAGIKFEEFARMLERALK